MGVTEVLQALGSWELRLGESTPDYVIAQLGYFGHVAIVDGPVDVAATGNALLAGARYVGVCRAADHPEEYVRGGSGLLFWVGDEDGKGYVIESQVTLTSATLAQVVTALLPPTVTVGTVFAQVNPATRYTGNHIFQTPREALAIALAPFDAEIRVNPDFTVDVGSAAQLYNTATPDTIIKRWGAGADVDLTAIGGDFDVTGSAVDTTTRVVLLGQTTGTGDVPDTVFATGSASAPAVPWKDPQGNTAKFTRLISESGETTGSVAARAQLQLNRFYRTTTALKVTADQFEIRGTFDVGDATYVYDPDTGVVNPALEVFFRGEVLHPDIVRVSERTWPIVEGMTVAWRTDAGVWLDLTPWIVWETSGSHELTVGDLPKTLLRSSQPNAGVQDRVDAAAGIPSTKVPKTPTGLALSTSSAANAEGRDSAVITASWSAVTQYVDNTTAAVHHYEVQFRPQFRSPGWTGSFITSDLAADLPVTPALGYDVQVRAVSTGGVASAWSTSASIVSAADSTGPATPSDPVVSQYLGLLRIYWDGLTSTGTAMPSDFNRVDVHVGTTSGFTASAATLVSSLSAAGYAHAQAPYGTARFARFIAYDHNGNPSASSATVSGTTVQAADGDVASLSVGKLTAGTMSADVVVSGRFATALTGARVEMNALGFQKYDASSNLLVSITGTTALLTGTFKTALTGRRIEIASAGSTGKLQFFAPDGTESYVISATYPGGGELLQMQVPLTGAYLLWNAVSAYKDSTPNETIYIASRFVQVFVGGAAGPDHGFVVYYCDNRATFSTPYALYSAGSNGNFFTIPASGGLFQVSDQNNDVRLQLDTSNLTYYDATGNHLRLWIADGGNPGMAYYASTGGIRAEWADTISYFWHGPQATTGWLEMGPGGISGAGTYSSNYIGFNTPESPAHLIFGSMIKFARYTGGNPGIEILNADASGFEAIKASAFVVSSSETVKDNIRDFGAGAMDKLRPAKVKAFHRKGTDPGVEEIGVLAEQMPPEVVLPGGEFGPMVSVTGYMAMQLAAIQEIDARLTTLEKGKAA